LENKRIGEEEDWRGREMEKKRIGE